MDYLCNIALKYLIYLLRIINRQQRQQYCRAERMQPFPPLKDFWYLIIPFIIKLVRPVSIWYFLVECLCVLTFRSGVVYENYCTLATFQFLAAMLGYLNGAYIYRYLLKHVHYRLGKSLMNTFGDYLVWIAIAEMVCVISFSYLGYLKYKTLKASRFERVQFFH